jgi:hypothetical protein
MYFFIFFKAMQVIRFQTSIFVTRSSKTMHKSHFNILRKWCFMHVSLFKTCRNA